MDTGGGWREMSAAGRNPSNTAAVLRFDELFLFSTSFFSLTPYSTAREPTTTMRRGAGGSFVALKGLKGYFKQKQWEEQAWGRKEYPLQSRLHTQTVGGSYRSIVFTVLVLFQGLAGSACGREGAHAGGRERPVRSRISVYGFGEYSSLSDCSGTRINPAWTHVVGLFFSFRWQFVPRISATACP